MTEPDDILAELAGLRTLFLADLGPMLEAIETLFAERAAAPRPTAGEELIRQVHSLAGTSETFGIDGVGRAARHLEEILETDGLRDGIAAAGLADLRRAAATVLP